VIPLIKWVDKYLGTPACLFLGISSLFRRRILSFPKRILCIQLWGIGETILTLPAINALQEKFPDSEISVLCTARNKDVYFEQGITVIELPLRLLSIPLWTLKNWKKFDLIVDMEEYLNISSLISFLAGRYRIGYSHGARSLLYHDTIDYKDNQHCSQTFMDLLRPLGIEKQVTSLTPLSVDKTSEGRAERYLAHIGIDAHTSLIALSPGAAESAKIRMWPDERWTDLISRLQRWKRYVILLVGAEDVKETNERIITGLKKKERVYNIAGETTVKELFALCKRIGLMVSIDSGPMHIAAAQGAPTIGLFGPNTPVRFGPLGKKCIAIYKTKETPVINVHKGEVPNHTTKDFMRDISVDDVFNAVKKIA
jgi:ADP-heptose:LPS heptosyltransferase